MVDQFSNVRKKRIGILTPVLPPYVGGMGKAALDEAECLAERHEVVIFTPKYDYVDARFPRGVIARSSANTECRGNPCGEPSRTTCGEPSRTTCGEPSRTIKSPRFARDDNFPENQQGSLEIRYLKPLLALGNAAVLPNLKKELVNFDIVYLHYPFFGTAERIFFDTWKYQRKVSKGKALIIRYHMDVVGYGVFKPFFGCIQSF